MSWTDERVELLKKLWAEGLSASQVASELGGVTRNAVLARCIDWGFPVAPKQRQQHRALGVHATRPVVPLGQAAPQPLRQA